MIETLLVTGLISLAITTFFIALYFYEDYGPELRRLITRITTKGGKK